MVLKALIIQEENYQEELIQLLTLYIPTVNLVGISSSPEKGLELIHSENPDLIFWDVMYDRRESFHILDPYAVPKNKIVFTCFSPQFAQKAFRYKPVFYLLKPITQLNFEHALKAFFYQYNRTHYNTITLAEAPSEILTPSPLSSEISFDQVVYCKQNNSGTHIYLNNDKEIRITEPLCYLETLLPQQIFGRINDHCIINFNYLQRIDDSHLSGIIMQSGRRLQLSDNRKESLIRQLSQVALIA